MGVFDDELAVDEDAPEETSEGQADEPQAEGPAEGQPSEQEAQTATAPQGGPEAKEAQTQEPQLILGKFKSHDEVIRAYQELERKLGARDAEKENLRAQVAFLTQYLQTMLPQEQAPQPQAQATGSTQPQEDDDPEKWLEDFYANGPKAIDARIERRLRELEAKFAKAFEPIQAHLTQDEYNKQALALAAKYPDLKDLAPKMIEMYERYPMLAVMPNGMELAYRAVKMGETQQQAANEASTAAKEAARLPASNATRGTKQQTPEDLIRQSIFGGPQESQGIFG